jgi:hypothetical protein
MEERIKRKSKSLLVLRTARTWKVMISYADIGTKWE